MSEDSKGYQFGTFKGVFTPSILTILGVLMYLRLGWVLGNAGLGWTLVIVVLASCITFVTGLSLATLATNMKIGGGGAYYIISRSLGIEAGSAIGLPLYLAQALAVSFYIAGFSESVVEIFTYLDPRVVGVVTLTLLLCLVTLSADLALKSQFLIMLVILISLVSFFMGDTPEPLSTADTTDPLPPKLGFWVVFAVFFPAVTGIEAGIAMSGDLKNPAKSLPLGTMIAILTGLAVYISIPLFLHFKEVSEYVLLTDPLVMGRVAKWGNAIIVGVWAASLSSAMGALLGAPRTLQALAQDRVIPRFIGKGVGKGNNPILATCISFSLALAGILLGDIDLIAPVLSMFFLTSYGILNLSAGLEELVSPPSWRPTFRVPAYISLVGFFLCFGVMFMINAGSTFIAAAISLSIYMVMKRRQMRSRWGDVRLGVLMMAAHEILHRLAGQVISERTWKPNLLVLSGAPTSRWYLIKIADAVAQGSGFVTVASILPVNACNTDRSRSLAKTVREHLKKNEVRAFVRIYPADDVLEGVRSLVRTYGFGPLIPNTVLLGETEKVENYRDFARVIHEIHACRKNLIIVRESKKECVIDPGSRLDIWWAGKSSNLAFMFTVAYLMERSEKWIIGRMCLKMITDSDENRPNLLVRIQEFLQTGRLKAEVEIIATQGREPFDIIRESSADAGMVFLGLRNPLPEEDYITYSQYYHELLLKTTDLPLTALMMANEDVEFERILGT